MRYGSSSICASASVSLSRGDQASCDARVLGVSRVSTPTYSPTNVLADKSRMAQRTFGARPHGSLQSLRPTAVRDTAPKSAATIRAAASFHVKTLERIFNMEEITSPEVHRQLSRMYAMRRPRIEEDTAVNWPSFHTRDSSDDVHG